VLIAAGNVYVLGELQELIEAELVLKCEKGFVAEF
jgi:hypothetical protein